MSCWYKFAVVRQVRAIWSTIRSLLPFRDEAGNGILSRLGLRFSQLRLGSTAEIRSNSLLSCLTGSLVQHLRAFQEFEQFSRDLFLYVLSLFRSPMS